MDLPKKIKTYSQKYRSEWENLDIFKGWLKPASGNSTKAFCIYCSVEIQAKIFDIKKHAETKKHRQKLDFRTGNKEIPFKAVPKNNATLNGIRQRCSGFLVKLYKELQQRLPDNYRKLEMMAQLSPEEATKPTKSNSIVSLAEILGFTPENIEKMVQQWHLLHMVKWVSQEIMQFWVEVGNYKNASGENIYKDISELAMSCLSLPHSNAEVERLFSQMNLVKNSKKRILFLVLKTHSEEKAHVASTALCLYRFFNKWEPWKNM